MKLYEIKQLNEGMYNVYTDREVSAFKEIEDPTVDEFMDLLRISPEYYKVRKTFGMSAIDTTTDIEMTVDALDDASRTFIYRWGDIGGDFAVYSGRNKDIRLAEFCGPSTVSGTFTIDGYDGKNLRDGPSEVTGEYVINNAPNLISLEGLPREIGDNLTIGYAEKLTSLDHICKEIKGRITIHHGHGLSLIGVADKIHKMDGDISLMWTDIKEGGLGLMNIAGCQGLWESLQDLTMPGADKPSPWEIIDKHMRGDKDIFACQTELIEAGYEVYAQL